MSDMSLSFYDLHALPGMLGQIATDLRAVPPLLGTSAAASASGSPLDTAIVQLGAALASFADRTAREIDDDAQRVQQATANYERTESMIVVGTQRIDGVLRRATTVPRPLPN